MRRGLRDPEAAVLLDRRQIVVAPDQRRLQVVEDDDGTGGERRVLLQVRVAEVEAPTVCLGRSGWGDAFGFAPIWVTWKWSGSNAPGWPGPRDCWRSQRPSKGRPVAGLIFRFGSAVDGCAAKLGSVFASRRGSTGRIGSGSANPLNGGRLPEG